MELKDIKCLHETLCEECASKPGSPDLCRSCLANRQKIFAAVQFCKDTSRKVDLLMNEIENWKLATGLKDSDGGVGGVTSVVLGRHLFKLGMQRQNAESRINALEADVHRLDKTVTVQEIRERVFFEIVDHLVGHVHGEEFG